MYTKRSIQNRFANILKKKKNSSKLEIHDFFFQKFNRFLKEKKLEIHANNDKYGIASYQYTLLPSYK